MRGKEGAGGPRYYGHEVFLKLDARPKATRRYVPRIKYAYHKAVWPVKYAIP